MIIISLTLKLCDDYNTPPSPIIKFPSSSEGSGSDSHDCSRRQILRHLSQLWYDISWESSASRGFSWNIMPYMLFLKKRQNLKLSSGGSLYWIDWNSEIHWWNTPIKYLVCSYDEHVCLSILMPYPQKSDSLMKKSLTISVFVPKLTPWLFFTPVWHYLYVNCSSDFFLTAIWWPTCRALLLRDFQKSALCASLRLIPSSVNHDH